MQEQWRDIYFKQDDVIWDFRELYQVSSEGKVKSLERYDNMGRLRKEKVLKPEKNKYGYLRVELCKNGKVKTFNIHRLVAHMFLKNDDPKHKVEVNHIDENKENNSVSNLEWCTPKENINHGTRNERSRKTKSRKVIGYSLTDTKVIVLQSTQQAKKFGFCQVAICKCCNGKYYGSHEYKGYKWFYLDDIKNNKLEEED